ncbi:hypothetical protein MLGJGCBP_08156 [Rhodococcus sp. T7]|nr:hypothetical protein MLGJGCBP_08156 [Rhodococcus sp. T7]
MYCAAEGVRSTEPGVVDQHDQHVRGAVGGLGSGHDRPVLDRLIECSADRPAECAIRDRQPRPVRLELAHRLGQCRFEVSQARSVDFHHRLHRRSSEYPLHREPARHRQHGDHHTRARGQRFADLVLQSALDPVVGELSDQRAGSRAHRDRGKHRRREQADRETDGGTPAGAFSARMVTGVDQGGVALGVLGHQHRAAKRDRPFAHLIGEGVEVEVTAAEILVSGHENQRGVVTHGLLRIGCVVPRNGDGLSSRCSSVPLRATRRRRSSTSGPPVGSTVCELSRWDLTAAEVGARPQPRCGGFTSGGSAHSIGRARARCRRHRAEIVR